MNYREAMIDGSLPLDLPDKQWCLALHGNHDEHQCHKKPGHREKVNKLENRYPWRHECYCGVWW